MKSLTMLGFVATAALALTALLGVGPASATVLCEENQIPCPEGKIYPAGSTVSAGLEAETPTTFSATDGTLLDTCTGSTLAGPTANEGGAGKAITGALAKLAFTECSVATAVLELGSFSIQYKAIENKTAAILSFAGTRITISAFGLVSCTYGAGAGTTIGTMTGGEPGKIGVAAVLNKVAGGFLCPATVKWAGSYEVTAPYPVYYKEE